MHPLSLTFDFQLISPIPLLILSSSFLQLSIILQFLRIPPSLSQIPNSPSMSSATTTTTKKFQTLENSRAEAQFGRITHDFPSQKAKRFDKLAAAAEEEEEEEEEDYDQGELQADRVLEEEYRADFSTSCCPHCFSFRSHRYTRIGKSGRSLLFGNNDCDVQQGQIFRSWFPALLRKTKGLLEKGVDFRKRSCLRPSTGCVNIPHYHHQRNHSYPVAAANYRSSSAGHDYKTRFRYDVRSYSLNFEDSSYGHGDQEGSTFPDFSTRLACRPLSNKP